ncbi:MAG: efflux RND transporter periplasmic adaptor subunit [Chloroflexi bacterium]|nr:efflux RND transporter periplasmic adaptor subunit [Chloroflexota bacterium]MCI0644334.1 efflux RND transporter periplasmic adaptor subunit [Chloroflexota bacterium]MCI0725137.1 efflux RND transporter periplasmic adaptor subunit [Chloroflexota bacterium]
MIRRKKNYLRWLPGTWLVMAAFLLAACAQLGQPGSQATGEGEVVTAFIGDLAATTTASGRVVARQEAALSVTTPARVVEVHVRVGDVVQAGETLLQLDTAGLALNVAEAGQNLRLKEATLASLQESPGEADVAAAEAAVASAQANLDDLLAGPSEAELAVAEANLDSAEASLWSASAELAGAEDAITTSQIQQAEAAVLAAQANLERAREANEANPNQATHEAMLAAEASLATAQAELNDLLAGPDTSAAAGSVAAASARVDGSQADYNLEAAGATAVELAGAQAQLAQAEATLAGLLAGPSAGELQVAGAEVEQARLALADAQDALAQATLVAPFGGVVTAVQANPGEMASGVVVELADTSALEVALQVDEIDVGALAVGQPALVTLETWPDVEIDSEVLFIAPGATADPESALITYEVRLSLEQTDLPIRVGMTANASLVTAEREDVLLVPNRALQVDRSTGTYSVNLVQGDAAQAVTVTVGVRDGQYTQILDGLSEGDQLLIRNTTPVETFGPQGGD